MRSTFAKIVASTCLLGMTSAVLAEQTKETPVFEYRLPESVSAGEAVVLDVELQNPWSSTMTVDLGFSDVRNFTFVLGRLGEAERVVHPPGRSGFQPAGVHAVPARSNLKTFIVLNEWMDLRSVGTYSLSITFHGTVTVDGRTTANSGRETVKNLTVLPRDPIALERRCAEWLSQVLKATTLLERQRAVIALSRTRDPVAVPFLLRSAEHRSLAPEEIEALAKIDGLDSQRALEQLSKSPNPWTAQLAAGALKRRSK